jgi:Lipocalin-like domain
MKRPDCIRFSTMTALGLALLQGSAPAQQISIKEQLVGTWKVVTCEVVAPDGTKRPPVEGNDPAGQLILTSDGHFSFQIATDFPPFASRNLTNTTPEENRAAVRGSIAYYGTYTVNDAEKTYIEHIERGSPLSFLNGTDGKRIITLLSADEMKYTNPGQTASVNCAYKRAK